MVWVTVKLTGKIRVRPSLFGGLILQVQEQRKFDDTSAAASVIGSSPYDGTKKLFWRDAKRSDVKYTGKIGGISCAD